MGQTTVIQYETLRTLNSASLNGSFQAIGGPLQHACCIIKLVNNSTSLVSISVDGVNSHDVCPANAFFLYDVTSDSGTANSIEFANGTQFYVNGTAGTGSIYLIALYNP